MVMFQRFRALKSKGFLGSNQSNQSFPVRAWKEHEKTGNIFHNFKQKESLPPLLHQVYEYRILKKTPSIFRAPIDHPKLSRFSWPHQGLPTLRAQAVSGVAAGSLEGWSENQDSGQGEIVDVSGWKLPRIDVKIWDSFATSMEIMFSFIAS